MSVPSEPQIYVAPGVFNQAIEFYWQPPISDGGSNITSYILESANIGYISVLPPIRRKARVANLINQTNYLFTLKATNNFGNSNIATYRTVQPGLPPERPSNLNVSIDYANIEPLLNISLTQPNTTNSSNITYNALTMYPLDNNGNIITNSSFIYERFSLPGQFDPITLVDTNTNYEYKGLIQSINDVRWSKYDTFFNFKINPNLPTNNLKLWLDPYDLTTLTLSNNKVTKWNDKSFNCSNAIISETFAPTYDTSNAFISFNGTQYMNLPANTIPSSNTSYTMFIYTTTSNINLSNLWLLSSGTPSANLFLGAKINNGNIIQSWNGIDLTGNLANFTLTPNLPILSEFTYDGNTRRTYINGTLIHSEVAINRNSGSSNNIIGSISTLNANLIGSIGSIVLYDRLLSDRERTAVENYLINRRSELSLRNYGNLSVWLDANDNNTVYNSNINEKISYHNPVSVWLDKSNNNNHAFQSNTSIAPLKKSTFGKDYLNFNSSYMISNISFLPLDAFLVVQLNNLSNINGVLGISPNNNNFNSLSYGITANRWSNDSNSNIFVSNNNETSGNFLLMEYSLANNNAFIRRNGSNIANITNFVWSLPNNSRLFIGNGNGTNFNNSLKGNIGEIIMFNKQLTDNERYPIEGYLAWKWGIQNSLPISHMFYNKPPSLFNILSSNINNSVLTFNLLQIVGLRLWFDSNDPYGTSIKPSNGTQITSLFDKSGNNLTGTASGTTGVFDSITNSIRLNNSIYTFSLADSSTNETIFVVYKSDATSDFFNILPTNTGGRQIGHGTDMGITNFFAVASYGISYGSMTSANAFIGNQITLGTYVNTNGSTLVYLDGGRANGSTVSINYSSNGTNSKIVGINSNIYEFIAFNRSLSLTERQLVDGYLAWKWNQVSNLPTNHPFKNSPPSFSKYTISYTFGVGGAGGTGAANGSFGNNTVAIINGITLVGNGGNPGEYNNNATAAGGTALGGNVNITGGTGRGSAGDSGGGGGGAIGGSNATHDGGSFGDKGADPIDVSGLFSVLSSLGFAIANQVTTYGSVSNTSGLNNKGYDATGFGSGGGGAGYWGGDGGTGLYGGGGGGASGYGSTWTGGKGGNGVIVLSMNNGSSNTNIILNSGSSYTIPTDTISVRSWVIGAGGGGSGATTSDGDSGGGGGAGGIAYRLFTL